MSLIGVTFCFSFLEVLLGSFSSVRSNSRISWVCRLFLYSKTLSKNVYNLCPVNPNCEVSVDLFLQSAIPNFPSSWYSVALCDWFYFWLYNFHFPWKILVGIPWSEHQVTYLQKDLNLLLPGNQGHYQSRTNLKQIFFLRFPWIPSGYVNLVCKSVHSLACGHNFSKNSFSFLFPSSVHSSQITFPEVSFSFTLRAYSFVIMAYLEETLLLDRPLTLALGLKLWFLTLWGYQKQVQVFQC